MATDVDSMEIEKIDEKISNRLWTFLKSFSKSEEAARAACLC